MPLISSPNQLEATSGVQPRISQADAVLASEPTLFSALQAQQDRERLALQRQEIEQQSRAADVQAREAQLAGERQATGQTQQTLATGISAIGTIGQGALAAKSLGLFGGSSAAPAAAGATPTGGAAATSAGIATPAATEAATAGGEAMTLTGAPAVSSASTGVLGTGYGATAVGGGALGGGIAGTLAGRLNQKWAPAALEKAQTFPFGFFMGEGARRKAAGASTGLAVGGAVGFAVGGPIGAVAGAIIGGLGGSGICTIHEAAYGIDSREVQIARVFRDTRLTPEQLRAYYCYYQPVADLMRRDPAYRMHVRTNLVDKLVRFGAHELGMRYHPMRPGDAEVAKQFLANLSAAGKGMPPFRRPTGEWV